MVRRSPIPLKKNSPTYKEEASLLGQGYSLIAGLDEVGRGPLAGPVVAGVAILAPNPRGKWLGLIRDSKQLSAAQREVALDHLREHALALEVGVCSSTEVDSIGIAPATRLAMSRALDALHLNPQFLLLDAFPLPEVALPQKAIVGGDSLCYSIAAASIVAKVTRDRMMTQADEVYPGYGFARHKGYGTRAHFDSLKSLGPCKIHRFSFAPIKYMKGKTMAGAAT
ncbi:MAG: ribonuclease HII [SAR202 cluster bacterium Casp-Chloro-G4]|nr:ribonuclease HII [Chloroflexota bacterium]MDA1226459.1 ribonuclease HII [Chloroflexota bacterium]PKB61075.1 MAG: ribonuclease HII [SAR202 cluster bacterium Casp-Chloro-G4]